MTVRESAVSPPLRMLVAVALAGIVCGCQEAWTRAEGPTAVPDTRPASHVVRVRASYPGADAKVVADTVTSPLLLQLDGVDGAERIESVSRDETCEIVVRFGPKADAGRARVLVQNRVALAEPLLPEAVRRPGLTIDTRDPEQLPSVWLTVRGGAGADPLIAAHVARTTLTGTLLRIAGVETVGVDGLDSRLLVLLDTDKLADRGLTTADVVAALEKQNVRVEAAGRTALALKSSGRMLDAETAAGVVVRVDANLKPVRLRDVGRVEKVAVAGGFALRNGEVVALVRVTGLPGHSITAPVTEAVAALGKNLPAGVRVETFADLSIESAALAWVELALPAGAGPARTRTATDAAVKLIRTLPGRPDCMAFSGAAQNRATLLVKLSHKDAPTPADLRKALAGVHQVVARVSEVTAGRTAFPVRIALCGEGHDDLRRWADAVAERLEADEIATDAAVWPRADHTSLSVKVDRKKVAALGVKMDDLTAVLESAAGMSVDATADMKRLEVRGENGKQVPLGAVARFEAVTGPEAIWRLGTQTALKLTANPPDGQTPASAAARCVRVAEDEKKRLKLPAAFRVTDSTAPEAR